MRTIVVLAGFAVYSGSCETDPSALEWQCRCDVYTAAQPWAPVYTETLDVCGAYPEQTAMSECQAGGGVGCECSCNHVGSDC